MAERNKFLLIKSIALGGLCFPSPILMAVYVYGWTTADRSDRWLMVIFLVLCGGLLGVMAYYKDAAIEAMKDWFPSSPAIRK
jgi:hypothetical protein